ncbi:hypothetical protein K493DRAFT_341121 [Basidiobolus meristosporus CBS 931.73]|uniref:Uncharacterized protein n=1 Tax=Basidiobolus meristosporus CBS 931.73 TaxID=1314790 RepID=A0A1Y1XSI6_9FUNG|nr:hypothetical protein K493DRAFT_341121 [Basidiobolus meristosporus CBS 931.73]|eukprot:ORX88698.1 hypothetical protein K493DRAFT_341121 [Basidiobolus meristosporus CBS 931.73]
MIGHKRRHTVAGRLRGNAVDLDNELDENESYRMEEGSSEEIAALDSHTSTTADMEVDEEDVFFGGDEISSEELSAMARLQRIEKVAPVLQRWWRRILNIRRSEEASHNLIEAKEDISDTTSTDKAELVSPSDSSDGLAMETTDDNQIENSDLRKVEASEAEPSISTGVTNEADTIAALPDTASTISSNQASTSHLKVDKQHVPEDSKADPKKVGLRIAGKGKAPMKHSDSSSNPLPSTQKRRIVASSGESQDRKKIAVSREKSVDKRSGIKPDLSQNKAVPAPRIAKLKQPVTLRKPLVSTTRSKKVTSDKDSSLAQEKHNTNRTGTSIAESSTTVSRSTLSDANIAQKATSKRLASSQPVNTQPRRLVNGVSARKEASVNPTKTKVVDTKSKVSGIPQSSKATAIPPKAVPAHKPEMRPTISSKFQHPPPNITLRKPVSGRKNPGSVKPLQGHGQTASSGTKPSVESKLQKPDPSFKANTQISQLSKIPRPGEVHFTTKLSSGNTHAGVEDDRAEANMANEEISEQPSLPNSELITCPSSDLENSCEPVNANVSTTEDAAIDIDQSLVESNPPSQATLVAEDIQNEHLEPDGEELQHSKAQNQEDSSNQALATPNLAMEELCDTSQEGHRDDDESIIDRMDSEAMPSTQDQDNEGHVFVATNAQMAQGDANSKEDIEKQPGASIDVPQEGVQSDQNTAASMDIAEEQDDSVQEILQDRESYATCADTVEESVDSPHSNEYRGDTTTCTDAVEEHLDSTQDNEDRESATNCVDNTERADSLYINESCQDADNGPDTAEQIDSLQDSEQVDSSQGKVNEVCENTAIDTDMVEEQVDSSQGKVNEECENTAIGTDTAEEQADSSQDKVNEDSENTTICIDTVEEQVNCSHGNEACEDTVACINALELQGRGKIDENATLCPNTIAEWVDSSQGAIQELECDAASAGTQGDEAQEGIEISDEQINPRVDPDVAAHSDAPEDEVLSLQGEREDHQVDVSNANNFEGHQGSQDDAHSYMEIVDRTNTDEQFNSHQQIPEFVEEQADSQEVNDNKGEPGTLGEQINSPGDALDLEISTSCPDQYDPQGEDIQNHHGFVMDMSVSSDPIDCPGVTHGQNAVVTLEDPVNAQIDHNRQEEEKLHDKSQSLQDINLPDLMDEDKPTDDMAMEVVTLEIIHESETRVNSQEDCPDSLATNALDSPKIESCTNSTVACPSSPQIHDHDEISTNSSFKKSDSESAEEAKAQESSFHHSEITRGEGSQGPTKTEIGTTSEQVTHAHLLVTPKAPTLDGHKEISESGNRRLSIPRKRNSMLNLQDTLHQRRMSAGRRKSLDRKVGIKSGPRRILRSAKSSPEKDTDQDLLEHPQELPSEDSITDTPVEPIDCITPDQSLNVRRSLRCSTRSKTKVQSEVAQPTETSKVVTPKSTSKRRRKVTPEPEPEPESEAEPTDPFSEVITIEASNENPLKRKPPFSFDRPLNQVNASYVRAVTKNLTQFNSGYHLATLQLVPIRMGVPRPPSPTKKLIDRLEQRREITEIIEEAPAHPNNGVRTKDCKRKRVNWDPLLVSIGSKKSTPTRAAKKPSGTPCISTVKRRYTQSLDHEIVKIQKMIWLEDEEEGA